MQFEWDQLDQSLSDCILVGCDNSTTWLLEWWWNNYSRFNTIPVIFADFGMGYAGRLWCESHGKVIDVGGSYSCNWFKKPSAILKCKYKRILWIDLDCEVKGDISPILEYADLAQGIAGVTDSWTLHSRKRTINTGVLVVRHGLELVQQWAENCVKLQNNFRGDQEILADMLNGDLSRVTVLPPEYNWLRLNGVNKGSNALIMHWTGPAGKKHIKNIISPKSIREINVQIPTARRAIQSTLKIKPPLKMIPRVNREKPTPLLLTTLKLNGIRKPL